MNKILAWDLEISDNVKKGDDWDAYRPFDISCICVQTDVDSVQFVSQLSDGRYANAMEIDDLDKIVEYFLEKESEGYEIVSFNGASFDFRAVAENIPFRHNDCATLAKKHTDLMLNAVLHLGYPVGLSACAKGMWLGSKDENVGGDNAPQMWLDGRYEEVLQYCSRDVDLTFRLYHQIKKYGYLRFTNKFGSVQTINMSTLLGAQDCFTQKNHKFKGKWDYTKFMGWM